MGGGEAVIKTNCSTCEFYCYRKVHEKRVCCWQKHEGEPCEPQQIKHGCDVWEPSSEAMDLMED